MIYHYFFRILTNPYFWTLINNFWVKNTKFLFQLIQIIFVPVQKKLNDFWEIYGYKKRLPGYTTN